MGQPDSIPLSYAYGAPLEGIKFIFWANMNPEADVVCAGDAAENEF